jgi:hypothetical protein
VTSNSGLEKMKCHHVDTGIPECKSPRCLTRRAATTMPPADWRCSRACIVTEIYQVARIRQRVPSLLGGAWLAALDHRGPAQS